MTTFFIYTKFKIMIELKIEKLLQQAREKGYFIL
jgi:hypothetical protein